MRPQKAQISQITEPNRLDAAIDQVAARMVQVREDEDLAFRIAGTLPGRSSRFGWLIPQFAVIAAFAIAVVVWTTRDAATPSLLPSSQVAALTAVPSTVMALAPGTALRTQPLERLEPLEPLEPLEGDHERSLAALTAMSDLSFASLTPRDLPAREAIALSPIEIADLSLTAEPFPQR